MFSMTDLKKNEIFCFHSLDFAHLNIKVMSLKSENIINSLLQSKWLYSCI